MAINRGQKNEMQLNQKPKLKAVDFFSGAGGFTYGLRKAGISVIAGIDCDGACKETYEKNNKGAKFLERDITSYVPSELEKELNMSKSDNEMIFVGCAPCQYWSIINTTKEKSMKTKDLILDFQRFVDYFRPGFIIVENVPGISSKKESPMARFIEEIKSFGYNVTYGIADMSLYGIPQKRRRFTLLASRITEVFFPKPTNKRKTVRDVIGVNNGFPKIEAGTRDKTKFLHTAAGLIKKNIERLQLTEENGGNRSNWQNKEFYKLPCYVSKDEKFYDTYGRMWWDRPSPTITTKFFSISNGRFAHPVENRGISLREGASLQTFPKGYEFVGESISSIAKMIGNAVPPKFGEIIGKQVINSIIKN